MIEAIDLTVRRRGRTFLDAVSFDVRPGQVTGVLGGTGAGKTMLVRRMVHLERGGGETLFDGRPYRSLRHPMREVGLLLDPGAGHPDRTVRGQLLLALATDRRAARDVGPVNGSVVSRGADSYRSDGRKAAVGVSAGAAVSASVGVGAGARAGSAGGPGIALDDREAGHLDNAHRDDPYVSDADHDHGRRPGLSGRFARDRSAKGGADRRAPSPGDDLDLGPSRKGSPADRIEAVLEIVGLTEQSRTRLSDLTDGMATRLGIAVALLGDPKALVLDSPEHGLEPEGLDWLGALLRAFTAQGRAALVTGSDTETMVGMVDRLLLLDHGYLVGTRTAEEVLRAPSGTAVIVRSPQIVRLASILAEAGARTTQGESTSLEVRGLDRARVGDLAFRNGIPVHELSEQFTGSDPGDLVLAACSGRHRPIVPIQGFPDTAVNVTRPLTTTRRRRDNDVVRVTMSPDEDLFGSVRLLSPVAAPAPVRAEPEAGPDTELMDPVAVEQLAPDRAPDDQRSDTSTVSITNASPEAGTELSAGADAGAVEGTAAGTTPEAPTGGPTASGLMAGNAVGSRIAASSETGTDMEGDK